MPTNLWFTNNAAGITSFQLDAGDGAGYRTLTTGQPLTINYADTGRKEWTYKLTINGGTILYSHSQIVIQTDYSGGGAMSFDATAEVFPPSPFVATKLYNGIAGQGYATIQYANADHILRRPLIVAEGFDAGKILAPEEKFGLNTKDQFLKDATDDGSNLTNLLSGPVQQYDIIYVDWKNGVDYLQRNAYLLETIIKWVNDNKQQVNGVYIPNVVLGQSMGGVIARYALKDMENTGLDHKTRLYISHDAPHQGANVPQGYQHLARHARSLYIRAGVTALIYETIQVIRGGVSPLLALSLADQPASKQMLINFVNGNNTVDNTVHTQWQTELKNLGYPQGFAGTPFRFVAVSNGSECANPQAFGPGANLLTFTGKGNTRFLGDIAGSAAFPVAGIFLGQPALLLGIFPGRNDFSFDFAVNAQADGVSNQVYKGIISYTKKILWLIPVTVNITNRSYNSSASTLPYDYFPGGYYNLPLNLNSSSNQTIFYKYSITASNQPTFNFVPTVSALDIGSNNVTLTKSDYLTRYVGATPPVAPKNSPFQNFITAFNNNTVNELHISIERRNGDWVADEINGIHPAANCSFICTNSVITISGANAVCNAPLVYVLNNPPAGTTRTWSATPTGIVAIVPSPDGIQATVTRMGTGNFTLQVTISANNCGSLIVNSSSIRAGVYSSSDYPIKEPAGSRCINSPAFFSTNQLPDAINYNWTWPSGWTKLSGGGYSIILRVGTTSGNVGVNVTNACGAGIGTATKFITASNCGFAFTASPNPTTDDVTITTVEQQESSATDASQTKIYQIKVIDQSGNVKKQHSYSSGIASVNINLNNLISGIYIIQAYNGSVWSSQQIIKQ